MKLIATTALSRAVRRSGLLGLLITAPGWAQDAPPPVEDDAVALEKVTVTASKRDESLQDVAASVSAITDADLQAMGADSLEDYIQRVPGVVFNKYQPGVSHVVIRGIATSAGNVQGQPTTGYFLNEIPLSEPGWTIAIPDIDAFDVQRVEVLRGPQGTLFGSGAMGGAVNYVVNTADVSGFDAAVEASLSQTENADLGYETKGMVNLPLVPGRFALRAVAGYRSEPGYLDNIGTGEDGANDLDVSSGRLSATWTPSGATKLSWLSLVQDMDSDDNNYRNPDLGDLVRNTATSEFTDTQVDLHSLRLDQDLGWATLTALGAYQEKTQDWRFDYTPILPLYNADLDLDMEAPLYINSGGETEGQSLEVRLSSPSGGRFEWMVGAIYFGTDKYLYEAIGAPNAAEAFDDSSLFGDGSGEVIAPDGEIFNAFYTDLDGEEIALFGEGSLWFGERWKLTAGGRLFRNEVESVSTQEGFSTYPGEPIVSTAETEEDGFNPKLSLAFHASEDLMVYGLVSEGFRFGTPNTTGLSAYDIPDGSESDSLINYEIGTRASLLGGDLLVDLTAFHVDWEDIQLRLQTPDFYNYAANGGSAHSTGLEFSGAWALSERLSWNAAVTWQEAELDEDLEILYYGTAPEGSQLPGSAEWTVSNAFSLRFPGRFVPTLRLAHFYVSDGISDLNSAVPGVMPNEQGDYNLFDASLRMSIGNTDVALFGTNLTDERGVTRTVGEVNGTGEGIVTPRTVGVSVYWRY